MRSTIVSPARATVHGFARQTLKLGATLLLSAIPASSALAAEDDPAVSAPESLPAEAPPLPPQLGENDSRGFVPALPPVFIGADSAAETAGEQDLLFHASLASSALGVALALGGGFTFAADRSSQLCGVSGCVERPDELIENTGASLVGAGLGFALVGGLGFLGWLGSAPKGSEQRRSQPMTVAGFSLVAMSAASLGIGIAQASTYGYEPWGDFSTAWPYFVATSVFGAIGIPLLAVGAHKSTAQEREEKARKQEERRLHKKGRRSVGMMVGGGILVGLGGLAGLIGTGFVVAESVIDGPGYITLLLGLPLLGAGGLFQSIGLPLLIVGAQKPTPEKPEPTSAIPEVRTRGAGLELAWRWQ